MVHQKLPFKWIKIWGKEIVGESRSKFKLEGQPKQILRITSRLEDDLYELEKDSSGEQKWGRLDSFFFRGRTKRSSRHAIPKRSARDPGLERASA